MYFDREKYKEFARRQISGRRKNAALAILIVVVITLAISIPERRLNTSFNEILRTARSSEGFLDYLSENKDTISLTFIFSFITTLINFITRIALTSFFLAYSRSPEPVSLKVFFEGFNKWGRGILAGLWQTLWCFLWMLGLLFIYILLLIPCIFIPSSFSTSVVSILSNLIIILICILLVIKALEYSQLFYLVAEFPELGIRKALRISILITKGHRADIFATILTFLGYYILGVITLGFAQIWYEPYTGMTFINIYHALLKDALENGKINPEDLN